MNVVIFPDQIAATITYLNDRLPNVIRALGVSGVVHVCSQVPVDRPGLLVRVQDVGGYRRDVAHETALMAIQCWAPTDVEAVDLARAVTSLLRSWPSDSRYGNQVTTVTCSRPQYFPDPDTKTPRYQATAEVTCRPERIS